MSRRPVEEAREVCAFESPVASKENEKQDDRFAYLSFAHALAVRNTRIIATVDHASHSAYFRFVWFRTISIAIVKGLTCQGCTN